MKIRKEAAGVDEAQKYLREVRNRADQNAQAQLRDGGSARAKRLEDPEVNVSLGRLIQSELGVDQLKAERRARVEELKELVKAGKYNPSSEAVGEALASEIFSEIAHAGNILQDGESE